MQTDLISIREKVIRIKILVMSLRSTLSNPIWELLSDGVESLLSMINQQQTKTTVQPAPTVHPDPDQSEGQNRREVLKFTSTNCS